MTTLAVGQSILPVGWPTDDLYHSPIGLFDFQAEGIADAYFSILSGGGRMICWDTGCIQGDADIVINRGGCARHYPLSEVVRMFNGGLAKNGRAWDLSIPTMVQREVDGEIRLAEIANAWESGVKTTYTVTTAGGRSIRATDEHPFLTERGWLRLDELVVGDLLHTRGEKAAGQPKKAKPLYREVMIKVDLDPVVSIERYGEEMTYDIEVVGEPHNFVANGIVVHNTGKSHGGMRLSTLLAEDARAGEAKHDLTMLVCEKGKVSEWAEDFARFTRQSTRIHHGPNRMKKLISEPLPDVLITTYETAKADLVKFVKVPGKRGTSIQVGPLLEKIEPLSVLWVCDEFGKLRNRSAGNYKAFEFTFRQMKKSHPSEHRVVGLTATPIERDWEDAFNQCRLLRPELMPTVADFEKHFVRARDPFGRARYRPEVTTDFVEMCRPIILRKRKTDPDVVAQFPRKVEEAKHLEMAPDQAHLYETVESMQYGQEEPVPGLWTVLRQIAASPASLVRSASHGSSVLASALVSELGAEYLQSISSVKEQALLDYLDPLVNGQGAKVVVFTFFGQSVLPILGELLRSKGFRVYENHGGLSSAEMGEVRRSFKVDPAPCVFLTSDAGSRGINLPEATYVVEYESALTYANRTQRLDRIHRIDSDAPSVTCMTFVVNHSVEVKIMEVMSQRNEQSDILLDDSDAGEEFLGAADRRVALQMSRLSKKRAGGAPPKEPSSRLAT